MGTDKLSIVYGRIVFGDELKNVKQIINTHNFGTSYPYIQKEMFNTCWKNDPWNYESHIVSFCANYKRVADHWSVFVQKFESILNKLEHFESATINLETFYYGTYNFNWRKPITSTEDRNTIITQEWIVDIGHNGDYENYLSKLNNKEIWNINFEYPIRIPKNLVQKIRSKLTTNRKKYLNKIVNQNELHSTDLNNSLTFLELNGEIEVGFEMGSGRWIKRNLGNDATT